jgi:hypothetical protein
MAAPIKILLGTKGHLSEKKVILRFNEHLPYVLNQLALVIFFCRYLKHTPKPTGSVKYKTAPINIPENVLINASVGDGIMQVRAASHFLGITLNKSHILVPWKPTRPTDLLLDVPSVPLTKLGVSAITDRQATDAIIRTLDAANKVTAHYTELPAGFTSPGAEELGMAAVVIGSQLYDRVYKNYESHINKPHCPVQLLAQWSPTLSGSFLISYPLW